MADLTDVENALVSLIAATLYPNGTGQPSAAGGVPCMVYAGWPTPAQLDADLAVGKAHVSVFPRTEERNTTRFSQDWQPQAMNSATLTLTINGQQITVGGVVPPANNPHNLSVLANGKPYVYAVQTGDTLNSIAAALAALIAADIPGTSAAGAVVTLPGTGRIGAARVGVTGTAIREVRRQERHFQITVWADTPAHRDAVAQPVDLVLATTKFLTMPDGFAARLIYRNSPISDAMQKTRLFRRDLIYLVEYATTQAETETQITQEQLGVA
ncbi:MAG: hypothetical protein VB138_02005 [Burkholderia sp.]